MKPLTSGQKFANRSIQLVFICLYPVALIVDIIINGARFFSGPYKHYKPFFMKAIRNSIDRYDVPNDK